MTVNHEQAREYLKQKIGTEFSEGLHGQEYKGTKCRDYKDEDSQGTVVQVIVKGHRLKVSELNDIEGFKTVSVEKNDDGLWLIQISTYRLKEALEDEEEA